MAGSRSAHSFLCSIRSMRAIFLTCLLFLLVSYAAGTCPSKPTISPCNCTEIKDGISIQCNGPEDSGRIVSIIRDLESSGNLELVLGSLTLTVLSESVWKASSLRLTGVHVQRISDNASVASRLNDLVIDSSSITEEPWPFLSRATALKHLKISNVRISTIGSEFKEGVPAGIAYLDLRKTQTTSLQSHSMTHLTNLKYLLMVDMPLRKFPRDALPVEMRNLHTFIICNTLIEKLEAGFFEGMPKLEVLMLNGNQFKTLDYQWLAPVHKHLTHLLAERNPLICDCNIIWLSKNIPQPDSIKVMATCTDPKSGERKEVATLETNEDEYCS